MKNRATKNMPRTGTKTITVDEGCFEDAKDGAYLTDETLKEFTRIAIDEYIKRKGLRQKITNFRKLKEK